MYDYSKMIKSEEVGTFNDTLDNGERTPTAEGWNGDQYDADVNTIGDLNLTLWSMEKSSDSDEGVFYLSRAEGM
jgi:hypothetical protein